MISSKVSLVSGQCASCRYTLLNAFAAFAKIPKPPVAIRFSERPKVVKGISHRFFATTSRCRSDVVIQEVHDGSTLDQPAPESSEQAPADNEAPKIASELPWYLQVRTPQSIIRSLAERQRLPDLPPDPPPLLQPMLEHISIELGLDDLSLLDLRRLDPPPALGSNLLMVLGTARSEKHLHVSADRFCRWLRTEHKISPYADGLLGRGELKLKMRRKARRAKVLSRVGSSETGNGDDGIRTGWVCVNIGNVEDGKIATESDSSIEGYVGFGTGTEGVKLVIQMLTGEKREELELERLWAQALARQDRRRKRIFGGEKGVAEHLGAEVNVAPIETDILSEPTSLPPSGHSEKPSSRPSQMQIRSFHSNARSFSTNGHSRMSPESVAANASDLEPRILSPDTQDPKGRAALPSSNPSQKKQNSSGFDDNVRLLSLQSKLKYLKGLPREDAVEVLGSGVNDVDSTSFLKSFYEAYPHFPDSQFWECRLSLVCHAISTGHPSYTKFNLVSIFSEMQASAVDIPASAFTLVVRTLLEETWRPQTSDSRPSLPITYIRLAVDVLEDMSLRGENVMTEEIMTSLQVATYIASDPEPGDKIQLHTAAHARLKTLMDDYGFPKRSTESYGRVIQACADADKWYGVWQTWESIPANFQRRDEELYALLFRCVARRGHQAKTMAVLRQSIASMSREEPPVKLEGEIAKAVLQCLSVADPRVEDDVRKRRNERGEWVRLYRKCQEALKANPGDLPSE